MTMEQQHNDEPTQTGARISHPPSSSAQQQVTRPQPKSLFRRPGTKHYQLVHRSQRDPLAQDPDAPERVFRLLSSRPDATSDELDEQQEASSAPGTTPGAKEDVAQYGITYDDAETYDYSQHLRSVGDAPDAFMLEAVPSASEARAQKKEKAGKSVAFKMPEDVLPSHPLDEFSYDESAARQADQMHDGRRAPDGQSRSLRLDLDPRVREVLEALDDEAYLEREPSASKSATTASTHEDESADEEAEEDEGEDDDEDQWWDQVLKGGERRAGEVLEDEEEQGEPQTAWEREMDAFKRPPRDLSDEEVSSAFPDDDEERDTIADLRASSARRPPRAAADGGASNFSMSSSALFRNEGLRTLDDRFDEIEKMYNESDSDWSEEGDEEVPSDIDPEDDIPALVNGSLSDEDGTTSRGGSSSHKRKQLPTADRSDFEQILDDFLDRFHITGGGGKMRRVLERSGDLEGGAGQLETLRRALASLDVDDVPQGTSAVDDERERRQREKDAILRAVERQMEEESRPRRSRTTVQHEFAQEKERWDCETVLTTYSNMSNHPRMLRLRDSLDSKSSKRAAARPSKKIKIDARTGFPIVEGKEDLVGQRRAYVDEDDNDAAMGEADGADSNEDEEEEEVVVKEPVARPRDESLDEKKARKAAVKAERAARRDEKRATKETFKSAVNKQRRKNEQQAARAADRHAGQGVIRLG